MAVFDEAVDLVLKHEGGWVDDKDDPGGETNFGISKRAHPEVDIKNLTRDGARAIYKKDYWHPLYDQIISQAVANALFDFGVNAGMSMAVKTLQKAIGELVAGPIVVDGLMGLRTLERVNSCYPEDLFRKFTALRIIYYTSLNKPKYIAGWVKRAMDA